MCSPCQCSGSVTYIHVTCLKEWIKEKRSIKCELCGQNYSKKWKLWAQENRIIAAGQKGLTWKEKLENALKTINIVYAIFLFILGVCQFAQENYGLKKSDLGDFDRFFIQSCAGYIAFIVIHGLVVFQIQKTY